MKKSTKTLITSFTSLALGIAVIGGSTLSIFTSESKANVAVTSGNVSVTATASVGRVWSAKWDDGASGYVEEDITAENADIYTFANGGTVGLDGETLKIDRMTPGDGVEVELDIVNESSISIQFQTRVAITDTVLGETGGKLSEMLEVKFEDNAISAGEVFCSEWYKWAAVDGTPVEAPVDRTNKEASTTMKFSVALPMNTGLDYQGLSCDIAVTVYAVQSNARLADCVVTSKEGLKNALENLADSDDTDLTVGLEGDMAFSEDDQLVIPEGKNVVIDAGGNMFEFDKNDSSEQGIFVPEGSTLTFTDSNNQGEDSGFTLNVNDPAGNLNSKDDGLYGLYVNGGTLNFAGIDFNINNEQKWEHSIYVNNGGEVNVDANSTININGGGAGFGFFITGGSTMNIDGATINSDKQIIPIAVGNGSEESVLNFNSGYLKYENSTASCGALYVQQFGVVNIHEGATIEVCGDLSSSEGGNAAAITCVGGGTVNMDGGLILLNASNGAAYAITAITNYRGQKYISLKDANGGIYAGYENNYLYFKEIALDAHVTLSGSAKIVAKGDWYQRSLAFVFGSQRNGVQEYDYLQLDSRNNWVEHFLPVQFAEDPYTIVIEDGVSIVHEDGTELKSSSNGFAIEQSGWETDLAKCTRNAINDKRN